MIQSLRLRLLRTLDQKVNYQSAKMHPDEMGLSVLIDPPSSLGTLRFKQGSRQ